MARKKQRTDIPKETAARILFLSDRTCCVCRQRGKPVQIHHLDEDPSNSDPKNLAVLCFDCHRETQIRGGFDRKLDSDQITLYREDWYCCVAHARAVSEAKSEISGVGKTENLELETSLLEIYRENNEYELLAIHYDVIGNRELRDKYIELALKNNPTDSSICFLRGLQGKPKLIPSKTLQREIKRLSKWKDYKQRARLYMRIGKHREAAIDYIQGVLDSLKKDNIFSAAYYLKEISKERLVDDLFILALKQASEKKDLWWQVRALQELGWDAELSKLILNNQSEITKSDNPDLKLLLAETLGDSKAVLEINKEIAQMEHIVGDCVVFHLKDKKQKK